MKNMAWKIAITWIVSCIILAIAYPHRFFFLFHGLGFAMMLLVITLFFALGDGLLATVKWKKTYIALLLHCITILMIGRLLGGRTGLIISGVVGLTSFTVDLLRLHHKAARWIQRHA